MLSLRPGQRLSQYELIEKIGQGGMGVVWKALDTELKRKVAIKFLPTALSPESDRRLRFKREAQTAAALDHPNIAIIHEVGEHEGHPYIVMQLMEGKSLRSMMAGAPLPLETWLRFAIPMAEALSYAHRHGIVHRDLKPDNVMLTAEGQPKIVDFGLAKLFDPQAFGSDDGARRETFERDLTVVGQVFGTFSYMSPEQARGDRLDHRSDLFALGVIIYEMAGGRRPFEADNPAGTLAAIVSAAPQPITALVPGTHPAVGSLLDRLLEKHPDRRFQSADEVAAEMKSLRRSIEGDHPSGAMPVTARAGASRRRPRGALPLIALLSLALAAAVALWEPRVTLTTNVSTSAPLRTIAVVGFENLRDRSDARSFGRILMGLVTTDLMESGGLEVASTAKVLAVRRELGEEGSGFDSSSAARVAREVGAELMLTGQVAEGKEGMLLTAELVDVASGNSLSTITHEAASKEDFFAMAAAVADSVRQHLEVAHRPGRRQPFELTDALTSSPDAYAAYVEGERAFQHLDWADSAERFREAVRIDPSFALAAYRSGMALSFQGDDTGATAALQSGLVHIDRLPARWQTIYRAFLVWHEGEAHDAFVPLHRLVATDPPIAEAYYLLGEVRTHSSRHFDPAEARRLFERALAIDPAFEVVNDHLVDACLAAGDIEAAEALARRAGTGDGAGPFRIESELKILAARGRYEDLRSRADALRAGAELDQGETWTWIVDAHLHSGAWEKALEIADGAVASRKGRQLPSALVKRGQALTGQGRLAEALASFREAQAKTDALVPRIREFGTQGHAYAAMLLAAVGRSEGALAEARTAIEKDPHAPELRHLLGRLLLSAGRTVEAAEELGRLRAMSETKLSPPSLFWQALLQAEISLASGELEAAESQVGRALAMEAAHRDPAAELRVRRLVASGAGDAAAQALAAESFIGLRDDLPGAAVSEKTLMLLDLGRAEEALARPKEARARYEELLRRWGRADLPVAAASEARSRLERLGAP